jgi:hypothetical protein
LLVITSSKRLLFLFLLQKPSARYSPKTSFVEVEAATTGIMVDQATIDATADLLRDQLGINDDDDGPMNGRLASRKKGKQAKKAQRREQANRGSESDDGDSEAEECSEQVNCGRG